MSTKTSFKRIALVAASALAIAGFSAVPANATPNADDLTDSVGSFTVTSTTGINGSTGQALLNISGTITGSPANANAIDTVTITSSKTGDMVQALAATGINSSSPAVAAASTTIDVPITVVNTTGTWSISIPVKVITDGALTGSQSHVITTSGAITGTNNPSPSVVAATTTFTTGGTISATSSIILQPGVTVTSAANSTGYTATTVAGNLFTLVPTGFQYAPAGGFTNVSMAVSGGALASSTAASEFVTCTGVTGSFQITGSSVAGGIISAVGGSTVLSADEISLDKTVNSQLIARGCTANAVVVAGTASNASFTFLPTTAGTITITLTANAYDGAGNPSSAQIELISVIVSAAAVNNQSGTAVFAGINSGVATSGAPVSTVVAPASSSTPVATVQVKNQVNGVDALTTVSNAAMTISISGVGRLENGTTIANYFAYSALSWSDQTINVWSDSRSGTGTITVTVGGNVVKTFTVIFTGKIASITPVALLSIGKSGGATTGALITGSPGSAVTTNTNAFGSASATNNPAIALVFKDSLGAVIPVLSGITALSSSAAVVSTPIKTSFVDDGQGDGSVAFGYVHTTFETALLAASGQSATITYSYINADGTLVTSTPVKITIGGSAAKEVMTLDSASYEPGAPMTLTITATDSSGNPVYDGATGPVLTSNKSLGGTLPSAGTYVGGKLANKANKLFAPATTGDFTILGAGTDAAATALSLTATVEKDQDASLALDAANAATDAANNAYDEAQNATQAASDALAAVTALAAQVKSLIAMVKKLTKAVAKMNKKKK